MQITERLINIKSFHTHGQPCVQLDADQKRATFDFNERIKRKEILFEEVPCLCGSGEFSLIASTDRYGLIQKTVLCKKCGLMQSIPRMTPEQYRVFYESDEYRRLYNGNDFLHRVQSYYTNDHGESIYQTVLKFKGLDEVKTVLEFGAAGGWNLLPFMKKGISVKGYDFSKELVKFGNQKGIDLCCGSINDIEGKYDVIIANHVIEHFTNFLSDIEKLKAHLNKDGIMYVAVPDIDQFSMEQLQNAHVYYFTVETLKFYMAKCGLKMVHYQSEPGGHMSAVFTAALSEVDDDYLSGHYEHMMKMLKRYNRLYHPKKIIVKVLNLLGLKNAVKRIRNYFLKND